MYWELDGHVEEVREPRIGTSPRGITDGRGEQGAWRRLVQVTDRVELSLNTVGVKVGRGLKVLVVVQAYVGGQRIARPGGRALISTGTWDQASRRGTSRLRNSWRSPRRPRRWCPSSGGEAGRRRTKSPCCRSHWRTKRHAFGGVGPWSCLPTAVERRQREERVEEAGAGVNRL